MFRGPCRASVVREFLKSAQAARRGTERKRNSADLAAPGESVVREFLKSRFEDTTRFEVCADPLSCAYDIVNSEFGRVDFGPCAVLDACSFRRLSPRRSQDRLSDFGRAGVTTSETGHRPSAIGLTKSSTAGPLTKAS